MTSRERFLAACSLQPLERPPVWIMRQAGRYLPEYRALKTKYSFLEMVKTPELAMEVTLQPLRRFPLDAAILFSDILVIPEALGQPYRFKDEGGIAMQYRLETSADLNQLGSTAEVASKLDYVGQALKLLKRELGGEKALLGFGGSPWTLACYMIEGGGSETFARALAAYRYDRSFFNGLMQKLTESLIAYFKMQIEAGADAIQIFDSWGGILPVQDYEQASLHWIKQIVAALPPNFPVILYAKGTSDRIAQQANSGIRVLSVDWTTPIELLARQLPKTVAIQGNLAPELMNGSPEIVREETKRILAAMRDRPGHIFNLGHGIMPEAKIESVHALVDTVVTWTN